MTIEFDEGIVSRALLLIWEISGGQFGWPLSKQDAPRRTSPVPGGHASGFDSAFTDTLNQVQHLIDTAFLAGRPVLIHKHMDDGGWMHVQNRIPFTRARGASRIVNVRCWRLRDWRLHTMQNKAPGLKSRTLSVP